MVDQYNSYIIVGDDTYKNKYNHRLIVFSGIPTDTKQLTLVLKIKNLGSLNDGTEELIFNVMLNDQE